MSLLLTLCIWEKLDQLNWQLVLGPILGTRNTSLGKIATHFASDILLELSTKTETKNNREQVQNEIYHTLMAFDTH